MKGQRQLQGRQRPNEEVAVNRVRAQKGQVRLKRKHPVHLTTATRIDALGEDSFQPGGEAEGRTAGTGRAGGEGHRQPRVWVG